MRFLLSFTSLSSFFYFSSSSPLFALYSRLLYSSYSKPHTLSFFFLFSLLFAFLFVLFIIILLPRPLASYSILCTFSPPSIPLARSPFIKFCLVPPPLSLPFTFCAHTLPLLPAYRYLIFFLLFHSHQSTHSLHCFFLLILIFRALFCPLLLFLLSTMPSLSLSFLPFALLVAFIITPQSTACPRVHAVCAGRGQHFRTQVEEIRPLLARGNERRREGLYPGGGFIIRAYIFTMPVFIMVGLFLLRHHVCLLLCCRVMRCFSFIMLSFFFLYVLFFFSSILFFSLFVFFFF